MDFIHVLFWICLTIIFYTYIGYGILMFFLVKIKNFFFKKEIIQLESIPEVTLVIAAYNEEDFIRKKIENTLQLDYPKEKINIFFVTDGSTDNTPQIIKEYNFVTLFHKDERLGKTAAINRVIKFVKSPIVIFCDANTILNKEAITKIVRHYQNPKVGGVAGEKKIITNEDDLAAGAGEGLYWKYESFLKRLDSELYSVVGAAGELFSVRTHLYKHVEEDTILDDFIISLRVNLQGYRVIYEPEAYAMETPSASMRDEQKRKVRICAGGFQSILRLLPLLNFLKHPLLTFEYISHRVLRWTLTPLCLVMVFFLNFILFSHGVIYQLIMFLQLGYYLLASIGWIYANKNIKVKALFVPYYFLFMNLSVFLGLTKYIRGAQSAVWERAARKV